MSDVDVRVGHLPDPYRLDFAYTDGRRVGEARHIELDRPDPDPLRPYIEKFLREEAVIAYWCPENSDGYEASIC